jgi:hypothetical protein
VKEVYETKMTTTRIGDSPSPSNGHRLPFRALAALFLLALSGLLLLAACGGDDDEETTGTPSGTRTPAATASAGETQTPAETQSREATASPAAEETATTAPQASGGEIDPCALVTKEEAEAIVGESLDEPLVTVTELLVSCLYSTPDFDSVNVDVLIYDDEDQAEGGFELALDINDYPEVEGIGERAYDSRPIGDITVLTGKYELSVDVSVGDGEADFETAKDVAAKAVDRLS